MISLFKTVRQNNFITACHTAKSLRLLFDRLLSLFLFLLCLQVAVPDVVEAAKNADILIFVIPHQFIKGLGAQMVGKIKPSAIGLSLIKGFDVAEGGGIELISHIITKHLKVGSMTDDFISVFFECEFFADSMRRSYGSQLG